MKGRDENIITDSQNFDLNKLKIKKCFLQSGKRPSGSISVKNFEKNNKFIKTKCWIKTLEDPQSVFEIMNCVYNKLKPFTMNTQMPTPLGYNLKNKVLITTQIYGTSLALFTLKKIFFCQLGNKELLNNLYFRVGSWLNNYHLIMQQPRKKNIESFVDGLDEKIKNSFCLKKYEQEIILNLFFQIVKKYSHKNFILTKTHNDFTLRNILIKKNNDFAIIDWDAMIHPQFPRVAPIWNDVACFVINLQSLLRFYPFVRKIKIENLTQQFLKGYCEDRYQNIQNEIRDILYIFVLKYFFGMIGDRPLYDIYNKRFSHRFIKMLFKEIKAGTPFIF